MTPTPPDNPDPARRETDPSVSLKVAAIAIVAWAVIGVFLTVTNQLESADTLFAAALLLPALVGIGLSAQGILRGPSRSLATIGLMVNVALAVGAILLWLTAADQL